MGTDAEVAATKTFQRVLGSVRAAAAHWRQVQLTYLGRAHVAKQVLAAIAVYHVTFVAPPRRLLRSLIAVLSAFVADATLADGEGGGGISHPARHVASLPWEDGGVSLVDFELQMQSLQAGVAVRLLHPARHPWKELLRQRLLRAVPSLGAAAPVSALRATAQRLGLDARTVGYLQALQRTLPHRVTAPADLSPDQVRAERLFHNRQIRQGRQPLRPADWAGVVAAGLVTVGQLVEALRADPPMGAALMWECVLPAWQQLALQPASTEWRVGSMAGGAEVVLHSPAGAAAQPYAVLPDGRLDPLDALPASADAWQPCSVLSCPLQPSQPSRGEALFLAGPWTAVTLDSSAWGHGTASLCSFTVKAATQRGIQLRAARLAPRWFVLGAGCRPALWSLPTDEPGPAAADTGLQALELRWASSYDRRRDEERQPRARRAAEFEVELLPCQRPGQRTRLSVHARLAARQQQQQAPPDEQPAGPAAGQQQQEQPQGPSYPLQDDVLDAAAPTPHGAVRPAQRAFWERLRAADLPRDQYGLAYRIAHGSLYVGAFLCHISMLPPAAACCMHPACQEQLETLSHAFLTCTAVAPAAAWLCDLFAAVSGRPPPPVSPQILLADDPSVWQPCPSGLQFLWANMRLAFLASVWRLRCERSLTHRPFGAHAVALAVVRTLRSAILRDWTRTTRDLTRLDASYSEWFRGRDPSLDMEQFEDRWVHGGVLCSVQQPAPGSPAQLQLRLTQAAPMPVPLEAHAAPAAQQ
jgi:hypothetical protein